MVGDEQRYFYFANNLCHGFYSPAQLNLWNGPGYPILLMPFVFLKVPLISITLFNAVLQYLSIILLYKSLIIYSNKKLAVFFSLCRASYFVTCQEMPNIISETFASFLVTSCIYFISNYFYTNKKLYLIGAVIIIGWLVLTKIIFGYVLLFSILIYLVVLLAKKYWLRQELKKVKISFYCC